MSTLLQDAASGVHAGMLSAAATRPVKAATGRILRGLIFSS